DANDQVISNVGAGEVSSTSTDGINGSQLFDVADSVNTVIGGNAVVNPDGTITTSDIGNTGEDTVHDAIDAVNTAANAGWNVTDGTNAANIGPDGEVTFTGDANIDVAQTGVDDAGAIEVTLNRDLDLDSVTTGNSILDDSGLTVDDGSTTTALAAGGVTSGNVNLNGTTDTISGLSNTDLSDPTFATAGRAATEEQLDLVNQTASAGWDLQANGDVVTNVAPGDTVQLLDGQNIEITRSGTDVTIATADDLTADSLTINNGPMLNDNGIDMDGGTITNVGAPVNGGDAVNLDYFDENRAHYYSVNDNGTPGGNYDNDGAAGVNAIAAGVDASAVGDGSLAMGFGASVQQSDAIAVGTGASSLGGASIALGNGASNDVFGDNQIAIGSNASSFGTSDLAIGTGAAASGQRNIAMGSGASTDTGLLDGIAIGTDAYVSVDNGIALGNAASADHADSVALGSDSVTAAAVGTTDITLAGTNYTFAGGTPIGTVSVGDVGNERTITNVAAGRISASSTDAINGSQLFATNQAVEDAAATAGQGWDLTAQGADTTNVAPGDAVDLTNADGNLVITKNATDGAQETVTFDLSDSVTIGNTTIDNTGIDMGGDTITNLGAGTVGAGSTDGINGSQLFDVADSVNTVIGGNAVVNADGTITTSDIGNTGEDTVHDAIASVNTAANAGWNVTDGTNAANIGPNGEVTFTGDANIDVAQTGVDDAGAIEVTLNRDLDLDSVTTGNSTLDDSGLAVDDGGGNVTTVTNDGLIVAGGPSVTSSGGIDAGGQTISNVADGVASDDAATVGQITDLATTPLTFAGDSGTDVDRQLGDTLNVTGGASGTLTSGNIGVVGDGTDTLAIQLAEDVDLGTNGSITTGNSTLDDGGLAVDDGSGNVTTVTNDGLTVAGGPSVTASGGIDANDQVISNVGAGEVSSTSTDGINGSQLFDVADSVNTVIGGNAVVNADGTITTSDIGNTGEDTVHDAIASVNTAANAGWNVTDGTNTANIGPNGEVTFSGDSNLSVAQTGVDDAGEVEITLNRDLDLDSVTTGNSVLDDSGLAVDDGGGNVTSVTNDGLTVAGGPSITASGGIDANDQVISNVGAGEVSSTSTDGINGSQLFDVADSVNTVIGGNAVVNPDGTITTSDIGNTGEDTVHDAIDAVNTAANAGWNVTDGTNAANIGPNGEVTFTGDSNLGVAQTGVDDAGAIEVTLNRDLDLDSVTTGNSILDDSGLTVDDGTTTTALAAGGVISGNVNLDGTTDTISGLSNTDLSDPTFATAGRAATEEQLDLVNQTASAGWDLTAEGTDGTNVAPGDTVDLSNTDGNLVIAKNATEGTQEDVTFALASDIAVDSVTTGDSVLDTSGLSVDDGSGNVTSVTNDGLTVAGGPSVTASGGIDANDQVISNVGAGEVSSTSTDAVNGSQLFDVADSVNTVIGGNAVVNPDGTITTSDIGNTGEDTVHDAIDAVNTAANAGWNVTDGTNAANIGPDGEVTFTGDSNLGVAQTGVDDAGAIEVTLNRDLDLDSVTTGNSVLNDSGLTVDDGTTTTALAAGGVTSGNVNLDGTTDTISGLSNTDLSDPTFATAGRAATEEQLDLVNQTASAGWDLTAEGTDGTNVAPGDTVDLSNTDGNLVIAKNATEGAQETVTF
ncbi:autotransporter adhesin, partial [Halomonas organivorans]